MSLRVTSGRLDLQSRSISCNLQEGLTIVRCTIAIEVLRDLADHSMLDWSTDIEAFGLPEVERLATAKYRLGGLEKNGELLIGTIDLLRHGFTKPRKPSPQVAPSWRIAAE